MNNKQTIIICGGHITPAIALIDVLKEKDVHIVFLGRKYAMEGRRVLSFEYALIREKNIPFIPITAGRHTFPSVLKIPVGFFQAFWYCLTHRPSIIVSFGGYVAFPVAVAGWLLGIPVITHEQTLAPGLANNIIARIAKRVCVTFPETVSHFPNGKAVYTGLPMRSELFTPVKKSPFPLSIEKYPLLYITGGGTGAHSLNQLLFPIIPSLLKTYSIIHQTGEVSFPEAQKIHSDRYITAPNFSLPTVSWIFAHASLVLGRSGANTVMELAALGKVAMLVPLPWSGGGEQEKNAQWLAKNGGAVVVQQSELTPKKIEDNIENIQKNIEFLQVKASAFAKEIPRDGATKFVHEIQTILHEN